ncbi:MAG: hypothetical protein LBJ75_02650 [Puniceicoccales bacterium]|jgi:hypothetical protein|nr:hypothetical protein [Puniceicoccales bacterium]
MATSIQEPNDQYFSVEDITDLVKNTRKLLKERKYASIFSNPTSVSSAQDLNPYGSHVENLNLAKLSTTVNEQQLINLSPIGDVNNVLPGSVIIIGDRNWINESTGQPVFLGIFLADDSQAKKFMITGFCQQAGSLQLTSDTGMFPLHIALY